MEISFLLLFNTYYLDRSCPCAPTVFVHIYAFCCWIFESRSIYPLLTLLLVHLKKW